MAKQMSPLRLLQEIYYPNEWRILVCTILLNQTTGVQVHQVIKELFKKYPNAKAMANANRNELKKIITSLGLYNKRTDTLIRFSQEYLWMDWKNPKELHGIGEYAYHSWLIFINGATNCKPNDKELKKYVKWQKSMRCKSSRESNT